LPKSEYETFRRLIKDRKVESLQQLIHDAIWLQTAVDKDQYNPGNRAPFIAEAYNNYLRTRPRADNPEEPEPKVTEGQTRNVEFRMRIRPPDTVTDDSDLNSLARQGAFYISCWEEIRKVYQQLPTVERVRSKKQKTDEERLEARLRQKRDWWRKHRGIKT
jgi:hypothetical protein